MSESVTPLPQKRQRRSAEDEQAQDFCARPSCRRPFFRQLGRGRPQEFCCDTCRKAAVKELRRARARLEHYEQVVQQCRHDVDAFRRGGNLPPGEDEPTRSLSSADRQQAEVAFSRATGALVFLDDDGNNPAATELRLLYDGMAPVIAAL